jgi:hypothetical protein
MPAASITTPAAPSTSGLLGDAGAIVFQAKGGGNPARPRDPETASAVERSLAAGKILVASRAVLAGGRPAWWEISADGITRPVLGDDWNGVKVPGVIPQNPTGFPGDVGAWNAHLPRPDQPGGSPTEGDVEFPGGGGGGDSGKTPTKKEGGGNEYLMVLRHISLEATLAVLQEYVDVFLASSSDLAGQIANYLEEIFNLWS